MYIRLRTWIYLILLASLHNGGAIHFGKIPEDDQFKYMVTIFGRGSKCGGAVIDHHHILTAGHCVICSSVKDVKVVAGGIDWEDLSTVLRTIDTIKVHPKFVTENRSRWVYLFQMCFALENWVLPQNDIAVLRLTNSLPLGGTIAKVNLPRDHLLPVCQLINFAGWGMREYDQTDSTLRFTELQIMHREMAIQKNLPSSGNRFVAIDQFGDSRADRGDSGGPIVHNNIIYGVLTGVVGIPGGANIFTQVSYYLDFIENVIDMYYL